jgi:hypothetical protein
VVTLGGEGSCFASLTYYSLTFLASTNCAITSHKSDRQRDQQGHQNSFRVRRDSYQSQNHECMEVRQIVKNMEEGD